MPQTIKLMSDSPKKSRADHLGTFNYARSKGRPLRDLKTDRMKHEDACVYHLKCKSQGRVGHRRQGRGQGERRTENHEPEMR